MSGFQITESLDSLHRGDQTFYYDGDPEAEVEAAEEQDYIESLIRTDPPEEN